MAKVLKMNLVDLGKTKAFFTVEVDNFEIEGMKLIEGKNGLFVAFPSRGYKSPRDGTTKYIDIVKTASKATYQEIVEAAKNEYAKREGQGVKSTTSKSNLSLDDDDSDDLPF